ncbi:MAG TPA: tetratricopeptide repeat protein [Gemmatimonadaceae bacterium]|nr:tetratricopeptide repeat protein [Gemmatimonadaceae bacterium]
MRSNSLYLALLVFAAPLTAPAQTFDALMKTGRAQMDSNKADNAVKTFEQAVKLAPQNADAHYQLGGALGTVAEKASVFKQPFLAKRVKSEFEKAVELDPRHIGARNGLVQFYLKAPGVMGGSVDKAREQAAAIMAINRLRGHFARAEIANDQKDLAGEETEYRAAFNEFPDSLNALTTLVSFLANNNKPADAFVPIERYLAAKPNDRVALYWYARSAAVTGTHLERGEQILRNMIANPVDTGPRIAREGMHYRLGDIAAKKGDAATARAEYQEALRINPKFEPARKALSAMPK